MASFVRRTRRALVKSEYGNMVPVADKEIAAKVLRLVSELEELDDVQNVYANYDIPSAWIEELSA